jgi:hypothetical protein
MNVNGRVMSTSEKAVLVRTSAMFSITTPLERHRRNLS